jgi:two-component system response regulator FlrC
MLEAILFGHVKGAYTGAHQSQPGKFELAQGGTLLLDEISEMPLALQAKLLRVLQEREVERLGARTATAVDVRVIATTNVDVRKAIADGSFREDLYYRLSVFPLALMPLRERAEDITLLAEHFIRKHGSRLGRENMVLTDAARDCLQAHDWPGNVRELENVVQRALVLASGTQIVPADFGLVCAPSESDDSLAGHRHEAEAEMILATLRANNQQRKATAKQLGISERTLRYKLARLKDLGLMEA